MTNQPAPAPEPIYHVRGVTPRAMAVLVSLRRGSRTAVQLADALAEPSVEAMELLLEAMVQLELVQARRRRGPPAGSRWRLAEGGLAQLQREGLDATDAVKAEIGAPARARAAEDEGALASALRETAAKLEAGEDLMAIGAHERAKYAAAKRRG